MKINDWRQDYNQIRPHGAIHNHVPRPTAWANSQERRQVL